MDVKIKIKDGGRLLANADITIDTIDYGKVTIKNFQIWKSPIQNHRLGERVNISPPSVGSGGLHYKTIFFEDMTQWGIVEEKIWKAYQDTVSSGELRDFSY